MTEAMSVAVCHLGTKSKNTTTVVTRLYIGHCLWFTHQWKFIFVCSMHFLHFPIIWACFRQNWLDSMWTFSLVWVVYDEGQRDKHKINSTTLIMRMLESDTNSCNSLCWEKLVRWLLNAASVRRNPTSQISHSRLSSGKPYGQPSCLVI